MAEKSIKNRSNKRSAINIGLLLFVAVFLYIVLKWVSSIGKPHVSMYEVQKISLATNNLAKAVIVREEQVVTTDYAGYINYYLRSGTRVAKNTTICSVDDSRKLRDIQSQNSEFTFSKDDIADLKECVIGYTKKKDERNVADVRELKNNLKNEIINISDMYLLENLAHYLTNADDAGGIHLCYAPNSGIISFFTDSLDGLTSDTVSTDTFSSAYSSSSLFSAELRESGTTAYKLITNENWSLILNLEEEQYNTLSNQKTLSFTISDDSLSLELPASFYKKGKGYFAEIKMNKYLIRYINKRFLTVSLNMSQAEGLKIPAKSIVWKYFYVVPKEYIIYNQGKTGITVGKLNENGEKEYRFEEAEVYYFDDEFAYLDTKTIEQHGMIIIVPHTTDQYQVSTQKKLEGVYCVNKGFAQFRMIKRLYDGEDYVIVQDGIEKSIKVYDHILEDAETLKDSQQIY